MQGVKLSTLRRMLKVECGDSLTAGTGIDADLNALLETEQELLATMSDWAMLETRWDVAVAAGARYLNLPNYNQSRPVVVETLWAQHWTEVCYGIDSEQYNRYDSDRGQTGAQIEKWRLVPVTETGAQQTFEVWPLPSIAQTVRFTGQLRMLPLLTDEDVCTLDAQMLVMFAAAKRLALLGKNEAQFKLAEAQAIASTLRSVSSKKNNVFAVNSWDQDPSKKVKTVAVLSI